jgi:hypothetical protein
MQSRTISIPILALIGGTRGMLGAGIGLLMANRLSDSQRLRIGRSLLAVGLLSTVPLLLYVFTRRTEGEEPPSLQGSKHFDQSIAKARMADEVRYRPRG